MAPPLSPEAREAMLARLPAERLVVGGGITGAGIARDAALRGLAVALVERNDFAAGTSSRSSKLIHGGVRYLEQGDVALVRESADERQVLRRLAPHLTAPRGAQADDAGPQGAGEDPVLLAAGDVARCTDNGDEGTAAIIKKIPGTVAMLC